MIPSSTGRQRGIGLVGLLVVAALLVVGAVVGMQVVPTAIEYVAIKRAANRAVEGADTVAQIQSAFDRFAAVDDIESIGGKDLEIDRDKNGRFVARFRYTRRVELFGPASLLLEYHGSTEER